MQLSDVTKSAYHDYTAGGGASREGSSRFTASDNTLAKSDSDAKSTTAKEPAQLTSDQKQQVTKMQQRDKEVKAHEAAHVAAGGGFVRGGATFSYQTGPDGKRYAVGGEVSIDSSPVKDNPSATITKMQTVRSAALAPASPSGQDRSVAAAASSQEAQARQELSRKNGASSGDDQPRQPYRKKAVTVHFTYNDHGNRQPADSSPATRVNLIA